MAGFYSQLNEKIRQMISEGKALVDREDIANSLDLSEVDREVLERMCKNAMTAVVLYQNNYRSFVRGRGLFINYEMAKDPAILSQLCTNASMSADEKRTIQKLLEDAERNAIAEAGGQMQFIIDDDGKLVVFEELSKQELWNLLIERVG